MCDNVDHKPDIKPDIKPRVSNGGNTSSHSYGVPANKFTLHTQNSDGNDLNSKIKIYLSAKS